MAKYEPNQVDYVFGFRSNKRLRRKIRAVMR
jgi:hypothetical protein